MKRGRKAAAIREYLDQNPNATVKEVIEALASRRMKVSPTQVYALKSGSKPKMNGYQSLFQAKKMADAMGGVEKAREALDALAKLLG